VPFTLDLGFSATGIATMLRDYDQDHATGMPVAAVAARIERYTNGYPFLVSRLCQIIDEQGLPWDESGVDAAEYHLVNEDNTLFDSLTKHLAGDPALSGLIERLLLAGEAIPYDSRDETIRRGVMWGILAQRDARLTVANATFETAIYDWLTGPTRTCVSAQALEPGDTYLTDGHLNMTAVMEGFARFLRTEYRHQDEHFLVRQGRYLFLAFLKGIINGNGFYVVEPETRDALRMDVVVFCAKRRYTVELKKWQGPKREAAAHAQLLAYLDSQHEDEGWLLMFRQTKSAPATRTIRIDGRTITETVASWS